MQSVQPVKLVSCTRFVKRGQSQQCVKSDTTTYLPWGTYKLPPATCVPVPVLQHHGLGSPQGCPCREQTPHGPGSTPNISPKNGMETLVTLTSMNSSCSTHQSEDGRRKG